MLKKTELFILYSHIIGYIKFNIYKTTKVPQNHDDFIDYDKKVVYSYLVNEFKQSLNNNEKLP